nr:S1C family serine protease [Ramlibacter algicola]
MAAVCFLIGAPAVAATPDSLQQDAAIQSLNRAYSAVVGVEVQAVDGSRSAETLGQQRSGSGVVIGADGLVLTIGYLMLEADTIQVVTQDRRTLPARAVAYDQATGFGLVKTLLPLRGIAPAPLGSVADVRPGDAVLAATGGEDGDIDMARVVDKRPFTGYWEYAIDVALFTSPPIDNHSGAAVFNQRGELLGIGSLFVGDATGNGRRLPGNMFVPVDLLKPILSEMQQTGSTRASRRPWLGLTSSEAQGRVEVVRVSKDSPAEQVGMKAGDVVLAVEGQRVATLEEFYKTLWARGTPDADLTLTVLQGPDVKNIRVKPVDRTTTIKKPPGI